MVRGDRPQPAANALLNVPIVDHRVTPLVALDRRPLVRLDGGPECVNRVVDPRLGSSHRDVERVRDLGNRQTEVEVEYDGGALPRLESPEAALELIVVADHPDVISGSRLQPDHPDFNRPSHHTSALVGAGVDDQPVEPRIPAVRVAQFRQSLPGSDQRFLDRVLRPMRVAHDQPGKGVESVDRL